MRIFPLLDRTKARLVNKISPVPPPNLETLGFPPFGDRIRDRHRRWWKEGQSHPLKALGGKREGQDYMQALGYQVPRVHAMFDRITDLPELSDLPPRIVLKPDKGCSSKNVFLIENSHNLLDNTPLSRADIIAKVGADSTEPFLAEELLQHDAGRRGLPYDYKFNCFGSQIASLHVVERNSMTHKHQNRYWYLTEDWALQPIRISRSLYPERTLPPKPDCLDEMLALIRDVGARLNCFVRIDIYATARGPVFGEFTAFPNMGYGYTPEAEARFGAMWQGLEGCAEYPERAYG